MIREFKKFSVGIMASMVLMGNAYANTITCPAAAEIKQAAKGQGFTYSAPAPHGQQWIGENPMADETDLKNITFKMAAIRQNSDGEHYVACDYEGKKDETVRIALKTREAAKPIGGTWKTECKEANPTHCTFE